MIETFFITETAIHLSDKSNKFFNADKIMNQRLVWKVLVNCSATIWNYYFLHLLWLWCVAKDNYISYAQCNWPHSNFPTTKQTYSITNYHIDYTAQIQCITTSNYASRWLLELNNFWAWHEKELKLGEAATTIRILYTVYRVFYWKFIFFHVLLQNIAESGVC